MYLTTGAQRTHVRTYARALGKDTAKIPPSPARPVRHACPAACSTSLLLRYDRVPAFFRPLYHHRDIGPIITALAWDSRLAHERTPVARASGRERAADTDRFGRRSYIQRH